MHRTERWLLRMLTVCAAVTAATGVVVIVGAVVGGDRVLADYRIGALAEVCGIAANAGALLLLIRIIRRIADQAKQMEAANEEMLEGLATTDRAIVDFVGWCNRVMLARKGGATPGIPQDEGRSRHEGGDPAPRE